MKFLPIIIALFFGSCGVIPSSEWDYQAGFCRKHPECQLEKRQKQSPLYNPSIYVWVSDDYVMMESEVYLPERTATLYIGDQKCRSNYSIILETDIIPHSIQCERNKDIHHSHIGSMYVSVEGHDTYDCHYQPHQSVKDISVYRCQMET